MATFEALDIAAMLTAAGLGSTAFGTPLPTKPRSRRKGGRSRSEKTRDYRNDVKTYKRDYYDDYELVSKVERNTRIRKNKVIDTAVVEIECRIRPYWVVGTVEVGTHVHDTVAD
jgi:hypothetical protein